MYGIPCPGCGLTRAFGHFFHGDITAALRSHPLFFIVIPPAVVFTLRDRGVFRELFRSRWFWGSLAAALALQWVVRMAFMFPDDPPMDYNRESLLFRLVAGAWAILGFR